MAKAHERARKLKRYLGIQEWLCFESHGHWYRVSTVTYEINRLNTFEKWTPFAMPRQTCELAHKWIDDYYGAD